MDADQYSASGKTYRTVDADYIYWRLADFYLLRAELLSEVRQRCKGYR